MARKLFPYPQSTEGLLPWARALIQVLNREEGIPPVTRNQSYLLANVPSPINSGAGATIYVSDEAGGGVLAFSDGTDWRRVTDRAVIS